MPGAGVVMDKIPAAPIPKHGKSGLCWENPRGASHSGKRSGADHRPRSGSLAGFWVPAPSEVSPPSNQEAGALAQIKTLVPTLAADLAPWAPSEEWIEGQKQDGILQGGQGCLESMAMF